MEIDSGISRVYNTRASQFRREQKKYANQIGWLSVIRLLAFGVFAWFLIVAFREKFAGNKVTYSLLSFTVFLVCVFMTGILQKKKHFLGQLVLINENETNIFNGLASFLDNGLTFGKVKGFTADLSVFGKFSLYHLLNRAGSQPGKRQLALRLTSPLLTIGEIRVCQSCVRELSGHTDFRQQLLAHTLLLEEGKTLEQLRSELPEESSSGLENPFWNVLALAWPVAGAILVVFSVWTNNYRWLLAFTIAGLLILSGILRKVNLLYLHISRRSYLYSQYAKCFQLACDEKFEHPYLRQKQEDIREASVAFTRLSRLTGVFDMRLSMLSFFINGIFLLDLLCARAYLTWNRQYQPVIGHWFDTLGEMELLNSLATFHYNHPSFPFPVCLEGRLIIKATGMGHPLMSDRTAVVNDLSIGETGLLHLITGSNMSGKSTFLRAVGLNMILAQSGAPVFAANFEFSPVRLLTSFHHIDSLEESTSYFYAELKCLQEIVSALAHQEPALILLDEVMRGTNSRDKHDGTAMLIRKLTAQNCLTLIATHDTELGKLATVYPGVIENFCFESELSDSGLHFDYKIRDGVAQSTNATYLMQHMGII